MQARSSQFGQHLTSIQHLAEKAHVSNDHFIRTTDHAHREAVQYAWVRFGTARI